jgi:aryl-alcohol dehydrogenase-like predicted oxidoreductase
MTTATPPLPRRRLGRTELHIPVIPFGTQGFGNNFGYVADEEAVALIKHAIRLGVNHFDCARCYGSSRGGSAAIRLRRGGFTVKERLTTQRIV